MIYAGNKKIYALTSLIRQKAQELARRWNDEINVFADGDERIKKKLEKFYGDFENMPLEFFEHWDKKMLEFIMSALKIYHCSDR